MHSLPCVAVFDFDGTITYKDTLIVFLRYVRGTPNGYCLLAALLPDFFRYLSGMISRNDLKERIITRFLAGIPETKLKELGEKFSQERLPQLINPESLKRLNWHKRQGHRCILVTANVEFHVLPWAIQNGFGFNDVLATKCDINDSGILSGRLSGKNCWGPEKVRRLEALIGPPKNYTLYAYGDSRGDRELLSIADYSFYRSALK